MTAEKFPIVTFAPFENIDLSSVDEAILSQRLEYDASAVRRIGLIQDIKRVDHPFWQATLVDYQKVPWQEAFYLINWYRATTGVFTFVLDCWFFHGKAPRPLY